ncbi:MAG: RNHCP domain-containing protein [Fimbriimonadaceae bacterium]|nr:MAG: RNHCP domain-containing protein [Fimbriimonadaceae bacterium]
MVNPEGAGSHHRNHCPNCLHSLHLDDVPGDRSADCGSVMEPVALWVRKGSEWAVIHRCKSCGTLSSNRVAADDNPYVLLQLAAKPLANAPFPIERLP